MQMYGLCGRRLVDRRPSVRYAQMDELRHGALQVRLVGEHGELRLVVDAVPDDDVLLAGGGGPADGEEQPPVEGDLQEAKDLDGLRVKLVKIGKQNMQLYKY